jgi:cytochrome c
VAKDIGVSVVIVGAVAALSASCSPGGDRSPAIIGDARRGAQVVERAACVSCHIIPGMADGVGVVGPSLKGVGRRAVIAGFLPNTPAQMIRWLKSPQSVLPRSTMPDMGLTDRQARDVAAYLYTLR